MRNENIAHDFSRGSSGRNSFRKPFERLVIKEVAGFNLSDASIFNTWSVTMKSFSFILLVLVGAGSLSSQEKASRMIESHPDIALSGNLRLDLLGGIGFLSDTTPSLRLSDMPGYKSPLKAALFSAVIPGAGQAYSERYWQGLAFFGVEVGLWVTYAVYQSRGDKQTTDFQNYADANWSVVRYAQWITNNIGQLNPGVNTSGMIISTDPSLKPWQQVDWNRINQVEDQIMQITGNGFTHNLPLRPAQQYYELIGKYPQFVGGWDDGGNYTVYDIQHETVSPHFLGYRDQRGRANSLYAIASTATYVLVANHVLSALEAAWAAATNNQNLKLGATLDPVRQFDGSVQFTATATMRVEF